MRILVVDDHELIMEDIVDEVKTLFPDAHCDGFSSSLEALERFKESPYDVVLLDIEMPEMNGLQLAEHILKIRQRTNLIFITGYEEYALDAYRIYASAFLTKPISRPTLMDAFDHLRYPVIDITDSDIEAFYSGDSPIGKKLQSLLKERNISRKELAASMDVSVQTIYRWENGDRIPDIVTLMKLAKLFDVPIDEFT